MKKILSMLLALTLLLAMFVPAASAAGDYAGKTVLIYTGNLRGDVDIYAKIAGVKAEYEAQDANVILVDAGNYLQGSAYANATRGKAITDLMTLVGYDVAAMGKYDFVYGDATTGYVYHGNFYKYYTQAELVNGAEEEEYRQNAPWASEAVMETRPELVPASFYAVSSNITVDKENSGYYSFDPYFVVPVTGLSLGVIAFTDPATADFLQDGFLDGYTFTDEAPEMPAGCDLVVALVNGGTPCEADIVIDATAGEPIYGAYVIDNATKEIKKEELTLDLVDPVIAAGVEAMKESFATTFSVFGKSEVTLDGSDRAGWNGETNLGDLTADALKWYAENKFDGFAKDVPVVAIQNGGNCDNYLYDGAITDVDLLRSLPFSPMGVGILYLTGEQLLEAVEASTQSADCPAWAQVSGMEYTVAAYKEFKAGAEYGDFFEVDTVNRVTITSVGGKEFRKDATYAVIADNFLMNGNDTYYVFKNAKEAEGAKYLNNGNGVKTRDIVAMYIKEVLGGTVGSAYAQPQGRITVLTAEPEIPFVNPYTDVAETAWYYDAVEYTYQNGLMNGTGKDKFEPETEMTRAMLVTVLYRVEGEPEASEFKNPFKDVDNSWYTDAICWAADKGIVNGTDVDKFSPNDKVTREQMVTILFRYATFKASASKERAALTAFADGKAVSKYAEEAMQWAVAEKIIQGSVESGKNYIFPADGATRAEVATVLMRFVEMVKGA
ncbi:MAG: S-layer homology domain-containing protein [Faecousia sp.]